MREQISGFYSILHAHDEALARLLLRPMSDGGAGSRVLQVRMKSPAWAPTDEVVAAARMARRVCDEFGALCIVDDRLDIALAVGADGVHLGQDDLPIEDARAVLAQVAWDRPFLIGISTHDTEQVRAAVASGADYLGFGPVYATASKANPDPVQGLAGLRAAVAAAGDVPVVAIGGITPETAAAVAAAGAAAACVISAVNHAADPAVAGARISRSFDARLPR